MLLLAGTAWGSDLTGVDYAVTATDERDGYVLQYSNDECPPGLYSIVTNATFASNRLFWDSGIPLSRRYRTYFSFDLSGMAGNVDSARVRLTAQNALSLDWTTDSQFYYGDCQIGGDCSSALGADGAPGAWAGVTNSLITIPWGDIPAANDSMFISVSSAQMATVGAGHTLDLKIINSKEADVCSATGYNGVQWYTVNHATAGYRPVLYVWTSEAAAGKPALLGIDDSDIDLSNPRLIGGIAE